MSTPSESPGDGTGRRPPPAAPVLGVDLGTVRIGLAISTGRVAVPSDTLHVGDVADGPAWAERIAERIDEAARARGCDRIVLGLPRGMSGRDTRATQRAREVGAVLERYGRLVTLFDERLTSVQAERSLGEAGRSSADRRADVDRVAAALILQAWLDSVASSVADHHDPHT